MRIPKNNTPAEQIAQAMEAGIRVREMFPHLGITLGWDEEEKGFFLELSDVEPVRSNHLSELFLEYYNELRSGGLPFEIIFIPPDKRALKIEQPLAYLPPLAHQAAQFQTKVIRLSVDNINVLPLNTPEARLAYATEAAHRIQALSPHIGIRISQNEEDLQFYFQLSDYQPVEDNLLRALYWEYFQALKDMGDPFEIIFTPTNGFQRLRSLWLISRR